MLEIKITVTEMKNTFDRHIRRLVLAEERVSELEDISMELTKLKIKENKNK